MGDLIFIFASACVINNFTLAYFLGLCPFFGVTGRLDTAFRLGLANIFVMTITSIAAWFLNTFVLPHAPYLRLITFIVVIASTVQFVEMAIKKLSPALFRALGIFLPLITTNCAILGLALFQTNRGYGFVEGIVFALGAGCGLTLALVLMAGIREEKDASTAERALTLCNSGIMAFRSGQTLTALLSRIGNDNAKGEYYLTDAVALAHEDGLQARVVLSNTEEVLGVNSRAELAVAEGLMQQRLRAAAMAHGATLVSPETIFFSYDTAIGRDVVIEPNVIIGVGVSIEDGATIKGFCHFENARIGPGASVGPFTRMRPGAELATNAHVGNFVEIKNSVVHEGAKVNHLTYIGDASIGSKANIGAGTITCNYDGFAKHRTEIGAGGFIGSNSSLVAPVKIGDGAYIGSGSVITKDVPADALAVSRVPQEERKGWAGKVRARRTRGKSK